MRISDWSSDVCSSDLMPISERILRERQARYDRRIAEAKVNVPEGDYCYGNTGRMIATTLPGGAKATVPEAKLCPYWKRRGDKPEHANGYCRLMKAGDRSEEHTSELQSLMRTSYAVFCLKKKNKNNRKEYRYKYHTIVLKAHTR